MYCPSCNIQVLFFLIYAFWWVFFSNLGRLCKRNANSNAVLVFKFFKVYRRKNIKNITLRILLILK